MRPVEAVYLVAGLGIIAHGVLTDGLTVTELGAAMFFIGLVPVTRADRKETAGFARTLLLRWLEGERPSKPS